MLTWSGSPPLKDCCGRRRPRRLGRLVRFLREKLSSVGLSSACQRDARPGSLELEVRVGVDGQLGELALQQVHRSHSRRRISSTRSAARVARVELEVGLGCSASRRAAGLSSRRGDHGLGDDLARSRRASQNPSFFRASPWCAISTTSIATALACASRSGPVSFTGQPRVNDHTRTGASAPSIEAHQGDVPSRGTTSPVMWNSANQSQSSCSGPAPWLSTRLGNDARVGNAVGEAVLPALLVLLDADLAGQAGALGEAHRDQAVDGQHEVRRRERHDEGRGEREHGITLVSISMPSHANSTDLDRRRRCRSTSGPGPRA